MQKQKLINPIFQKYMELDMDQIRLYNTAWKLVQMGEYTMKDFHKFLKANNINIF